MFEQTDDDADGDDDAAAAVAVADERGGRRTSNRCADVMDMSGSGGGGVATKTAADGNATSGTINSTTAGHDFDLNAWSTDGHTVSARQPACTCVRSICW